MPDAISIGPAAIPSQALAGLLSLAIAALVFRLIGRAQPHLQPELSALGDRMFTALLVAFLVWKLTPLVFWGEAIMEDPLRLLRLPGGRPGLTAGAVAFLALTVPRLSASKKLVRPVLITGFSAVVAYAVMVAAISTLAATTAAPAREEIARLTAPVLNASRDRFRAEEQSLVPGDRPAIVTFWATWCGPCHAEIPVKQEAFKLHGDTVRFVAVNMTHTESGPGEIIAYANQNDLEYPIALDTHGAISALFGVRGTPTTVVLNANGHVIDRWMGPSDLGRINRAVAQASP